MSYGVEFDQAAKDEYALWGLPIEIYDQIGDRLLLDLSMEPTKHLRRLQGGCMQYVCRIIEEGPALTVHVCLFRVRYSQDEETLIIWDCLYFPLRR
jgi:hypothetical protein